MAKRNSTTCGTAVLLPVAYVTAFIVFSVIVFILIDECQRFGYEIPQFSHPRWRSHVEKGWIATEIVISIDYVVVFIASIILAVSIQRSWGYYHAVVVCRFWVVLMLITILFEVGIGLYQYSWYAMIIFRRGVVGFYCLYWFVRFWFFIFAVYCGFNRLRELAIEKRFGVKPTWTGPSGVPNDYHMYRMEQPAMSTTSKQNLVDSKEHVGPPVDHAYESRAYDDYAEKQDDLGPEYSAEQYDREYDQGQPVQPGYEAQHSYGDQQYGYNDPTLPSQDYAGYPDQGYADRSYGEHSYPSDQDGYGQDYSTDPRGVNLGYSHHSNA